MQSFAQLYYNLLNNSIKLLNSNYVFDINYDIIQSI